MQCRGTEAALPAPGQAGLLPARAERAGELGGEGGTGRARKGS